MNSINAYLFLLNTYLVLCTFVIFSSMFCVNAYYKIVFGIFSGLFKMKNSLRSNWKKYIVLIRNPESLVNTLIDAAVASSFKVTL